MKSLMFAYTLLSVDEPEKVLEIIKAWVKEYGRFDNVEEISDPATYFTLKLTKKQHPEILPFSVIYSKDIQLANAISVGWAWRLPENYVKGYAAFKDDIAKLNLIKSIKSRCGSKGLMFSVEQNELNLESMRIGKQLQLDSLTNDEFRRTITDAIFTLAFVMDGFRKFIMPSAGFDPLIP
jgi:hypothetical protein